MEQVASKTNKAFAQAMAKQQTRHQRVVDSLNRTKEAIGQMEQALEITCPPEWETSISYDFLFYEWRVTIWPTETPNITPILLDLYRRGFKIESPFPKELTSLNTSCTLRHSTGAKIDLHISLSNSATCTLVPTGEYEETPASKREKMRVVCDAAPVQLAPPSTDLIANVDEV